MAWDTLFSLANIWAMVAWAALILLPRGEILRTLIFYLGIGLLCFAYALLMALVLGGAVDPNAPEAAGEGGFATIAGVRDIFASDGGVVIGWLHYLAFDLFVGMWIARDADAKSISRLVQAPVLLLTFMAGPVGLLLWFVIREPAARRNAPRRKINL